MAKFAPAPRRDPADWWDHLVFREIFLAEVKGEEAVDTIRAFGRVFNSMAHEVVGSWKGTPADATAHSLEAVVADLRHLQGYLDFQCSDHEGSVPEPLTPRGRRWRACGLRLSKGLAKLADQVEEELRAGLALSDR